MKERESQVSDHWQQLETSVHQDHVIAHVLETKPLAYLIHDETIHLLLDIGFMWSIYLDGQMVLLPHPVAVRELQTTPAERAVIAQDLDLALSGNADVTFKRMIPLPSTFTIMSVDIYQDGSRRLFAVKGSSDSLFIETSLASSEILVTIESIDESLRREKGGT